MNLSFVYSLLEAFHALRDDEIRRKKEYVENDHLIRGHDRSWFAHASPAGGADRLMEASIFRLWCHVWNRGNLIKFSR
jgi:hypothetical protein